MDPKEETCLPFKSLTELYSNINKLIPWPGIVELRKSTDYVYKATENEVNTQRPERLKRNNVPKTIVCHDFKGGYLEDRFINGSNVHESYHFYHWSSIDTFVYFSHYLITIPPIGWINAAHKHGVEILGTLITEGYSGKKVWDEIFASIENTTKFADSLIYLTKFYKFDGWLLNVENEINSIDVSKLVFFVQYLTEKIHKELINSKIIWYDSVLNTGKLIWQNELNDKNECFFTCCDGIFLNYNWTELGLKKSAEIAQSQNRRYDVYVGLDVWGRGCPGDGGFNSAYALERIRQHDLSVAIFAPAWTFEYFGPQLFPKIEDIFWAQLTPYLYIHVPIYEDEKFVSSFCRGSGIKYYEYGMEISFQDPVLQEAISKNNSFYNMSMQRHQTLMPNSHLKFVTLPKEFELKDGFKKSIFQEYVFELEDETMKVFGSKVKFPKKKDALSTKNILEFSYELSYEGGGCLKLINNNVRSYHRLYFINIKFNDYIQARIIYNEILENSTEKKEQNTPILLLLNEYGNTSFMPRETIQYGLGWKMSIFHTNMKSTDEIGIAFAEPGSFYIGKIILEQSREPNRLRRQISSINNSEVKAIKKFKENKE